MLFITEDAVLVCDHKLGKISNAPSQDWFTIKQRRVLVENDPEGRSISHCPNVGAAIKPCLHTLVVKEGYSDLVRVDGHRVCLDTVKGLTDGTPPGMVNYKVSEAGQKFVSEVA